VSPVTDPGSGIQKLKKYTGEEIFLFFEQKLQLTYPWASLKVLSSKMDPAESRLI
jgi:hypothetical protein